MKQQTIAEVYEANQKIRENLLELIGGLSDEELEFRVNEKTWTIREIVEHLHLVENSMTRIIKKLLRKAEAENLTNDGNAYISASFLENSARGKSQKFQAPEFVIPTESLPVAESVVKLAENRQNLMEIKEQLETVGLGDFTFPHPAFGAMNAHDWLVLIGGHELRHIFQIKEILQTKRQ